MLVKDQLHRDIQLSGIPNRIVSLVPSQTELLVDLGLKDRLVGITKFCVHPKDLRKEIPVVGGTKVVHFEKIIAANPDIIICNKEENTSEMVSRLEEIAPVYVSDVVTLEDSLEMIWQLGTLLGAGERSSEIIQRITSEKMHSKIYRGSIQKKVVYLIWKNPYMAVGPNTFIHSLLEINRFQNIISESRYPEISIEQLREADVVLLSTEPFPFKDVDVSELKNQLDSEVRLVDGEYFSWYGSRLSTAFSYFKTLH